MKYTQVSDLIRSTPFSEPGFCCYFHLISPPLPWVAIISCHFSMIDFRTAILILILNLSRTVATLDIMFSLCLSFQRDVSPGNHNLFLFFAADYWQPPSEKIYCLSPYFNFISDSTWHNILIQCLHFYMPINSLLAPELTLFKGYHHMVELWCQILK